jgi:hypothetical protein
VNRLGRITAATKSPQAIDIAVTSVSNPASIPLTVWPVRSCGALLKPAVLGQLNERSVCAHLPGVTTIR